MTKTTAGAGAPLAPLSWDKTRQANHLPRQAMTGASEHCRGYTMWRCLQRLVLS